jgi:hypothetical protein
MVNQLFPSRQTVLNVVKLKQSQDDGATFWLPWRHIALRRVALFWRSIAPVRAVTRAGLMLLLRRRQNGTSPNEQARNAQTILLRCKNAIFLLRAAAVAKLRQWPAREGQLVSR